MGEISMPKLSDSMEQGTILSWLKATGDSVKVGDELLEIETDKSTVTYVAEADGVLEILAEAGATIAIGEPIARIGAALAASEEHPAEHAPEPPLASETVIGSSGIALTAAAAEPVKGDTNGDGRVMATPIARRIAAAHGVTLERIQGTGPLGRITRADVIKQAGLGADEMPSLPMVERAAVPLALGAPLANTQRHLPLPEGARAVQPSRLQQLIARRMTEAKATVPHFQVQTEVSMQQAIALRAQLRSVADEGDAVPSINDIIIKAAAMALREHPLANGSYQGDRFVLYDAVNVGMAVAAEESLVVPTVFDAPEKSLGQIARETRALVARVRDGEISPAELEGGTFTVSNLGMFGMTAITPVINPPQAAILGVGGTRDVLARIDGQIVDRPVLTLTLSCDHRILYGADAARFLARIRALIETPLKLAL